MGSLRQIRKEAKKDIETSLLDVFTRLGFSCRTRISAIGKETLWLEKNQKVLQVHLDTTEKKYLLNYGNGNMAFGFSGKPRHAEGYWRSFSEMGSLANVFLNLQELNP